MKNEMIRRIEEIDKKLTRPRSEPVLIDYESFSEAEKKLFETVEKIEQQYQQTGNQ